MKAKTQFLKMFYKTPKKSRPDLVYKPYGKHPMSIPVIAEEVKHNTKLGKKILKDMGYEDVFNITKQGKKVLKDLGYTD